MIFVGEGALLARAVTYTRQCGLAVDSVCCPANDASLASLRKMGIALLETHDPNLVLLDALSDASDQVVFSINNKHLLRDEVLDCSASFFNIHNGLVQSYRGRAEICLFAALCHDEKTYGVTLHRIVRGQKVDAGPAISQQSFPIAREEGFSAVMGRSLKACHSVFERHVEVIAANDFSEKMLPLRTKAYTYSDVPRLCAEASRDSLRRATDLGYYAKFFPRLKRLVDAELPGAPNVAQRAGE